MEQSKVDRLLSNAIFIGQPQRAERYMWPAGTKVSVIISILSDEEEYEEYGIDDKTFNGFQWHKLMCPPDNPNSLAKYYGLTHLIIHDAIKTGKNVIIHSTETQVRAGFMLAVYLILENRWSSQETLSYMERVRPDIRLPTKYIIELNILEENNNIFNRSFIQNQGSIY